VRDFYRRVVGWKTENVPMGGYDDYGMIPRGEKMMVAGVCNARGVNTDLPPVWLLYVVVRNLDRSVKAARRLGGKVIAPPRAMGSGKMAVLRDPAGAHIALYELAPGPRARRKRRG
jgi:predicted enzyme related to lactoylglutathione lyase